jgi:hypothetical protein
MGHPVERGAPHGGGGRAAHRGYPLLGLRHGVDPVFDPVAARVLARDRVAALCTEHDAPLTAITRRLDGSLTLCATCARRDWGRAD